MISSSRSTHLATAAVVAVSCAVLGTVVQGRLPDRFDLVYEPFFYEGTAPLIGEITDVRVTLADVVNDIPTNGKWAVIDYVRIPGESTSIGAHLETADEAIYQSYSSVISSCGVPYPSLKEACTLVFEMPSTTTAESIRESRLMVFHRNKMSSVLSVPLDHVSEQTRVERDSEL